MVKETKLSEFEKGEITALKRAGKSQREISKAVIWTFQVISDKYGTRKPTGRPKHYHQNSREELFSSSGKLKLQFVSGWQKQ